MANKVNYGLRNVYYASVTESGGSVTYGTPVRMPGAVNLSLSPNGGKTSFYADDSEYFVTYSNMGYDGTLEIADVPESFLVDILKTTTDSEDGVNIENKDASPVPFALLFEVQGDDKATRFVFYNVYADRYSIEASTKSDSVDVKTVSLDISCNPAIDSGNVRAKTTSSVDSTVYSGWFSAVYE